MFIEFTFKVNGHNIKKSTVSVTYTATNTSLGLEPHVIQQLGIDRDVLAGYRAGTKTIVELKDEMRQLIINASSRAQYEWNVELDTQGVSMPAELVPLFGAEWEAVTEAEATGLIEVTI